MAIAVERNSQFGVTLVELMIAMVLGLLVVGTVFSVYVVSSRNFTQDERYAFMQESGRYAFKVLTEDLIMADFWGQMLAPDTIGTTLTPSAAGCANAIDMFDATSALLFNNYHESPAVTHFNPCNEITDDHLAGTDILLLKRVAGSPAARTFIDVADTDGDGDTAETIEEGSGTAGTVYLRTNGTTGNFVNDSSSTNKPTVGQADWQYVPHVYFIRDHYQTAADGIPTLCRMSAIANSLEFGNPETSAADQPQCLAPGIEDLHLEFGLDTTNDGIANLYVATPTTTQIEDVIAARVYLLARSPDPIGGYTNAKTYSLGDRSIGPLNDGFYRRVFSTTVSLRNPTNLHLLN